MKRQASKRIQLPENGNRCRDCLWLTERYNLNHKGEPVLGRCRHSEHAVLLSEAACGKYKKHDKERWK